MEQNVESLILAAEEGDVQTIKTLLDAGVDVDAKGNSGMTALMHASKQNHIECVRVLLNKGANVNAINELGRTAIKMANERGNLEIVKLLESTGATTVRKGAENKMICMKCNTYSMTGERSEWIAATKVSEEKNVERDSVTSYFNCEQISVWLCLKCFLEDKKKRLRISKTLNFIGVLICILCFLVFFCIAILELFNMIGSKDVVESRRTGIIFLFFSFLFLGLSLLFERGIKSHIRILKGEKTDKRIDQRVIKMIMKKIMLPYARDEMRKAGHTNLWALENFEALRRSGEIQVQKAKSPEKVIARELAVNWWKEVRLHGRTSAVCDSCNSSIAAGGGYLCKPAVVGISGISHPMFGSPDLVCESCFNSKSYMPWKSELPLSSKIKIFLIQT